MALTVPAPTKEATFRDILVFADDVRDQMLAHQSIDWNEMVCDASVTPIISPCVLLREQALGHNDIRAQYGCQTSVATATIKVKN